MPLLDPRAAKVTLTVISVCAAMAALVLIREVLVLLVFAILLAYLLSPIVDFVDRFVGNGRSRTISLAVVYLALLGAAGAAIGFIAVQVIEEASVLVKALPAYLQDPALVEKLPLPGWLKAQSDAIILWFQQQLEGQSAQIVATLTRAGQGVLSAAGDLVYVFLLPILSFFLLRDGKVIRKTLIEQFERLDRRALAEDILADIHVMLVQYMRALLVTALSAFVSFVILLHLIGVRYALLLSVIVGLVEIVPVVGPLVSTLVVLLVSGFSGYPQMVWLLVAVIATRLVLDNLVQPYLMSQGVELHPMVVILGAIAGQQLGGLLGIFLSIPVLAVLRIVAVRYRRRVLQPAVSVQSV